MRIKVQSLILAALLMWSAASRADDADHPAAAPATDGATAAAAATDDVPAEPPANTIEQKLIATDIVVSDFLSSMANHLDLFLIGKKLTDRPNESGLRLENSTYYSQAVPGQSPAGIQNAPSISTILQLPNVEQYWSLKFTSYDETREKTVQESQLRQTPRQRNYGATVGCFNKLGDISTAFEPREELQNPIKISHSLSFASKAGNKTFTVSPKIEFYASADRGTGIFNSLNFRFPINDIYSLSEINEGDYSDKSHFYGASNGLSLSQLVTSRSSLAYSFFLNSNNNAGYHMSAYHVAVSWYQLLYKRILDYTITPAVNFENTTDYTGVLNIAMTFSLNF